MDKDIVKANALIDACYKPASVWQMRLLLAAMLDIKAGEKIDHQRDFVVTAGSLADLTGNGLRGNYRHLARAADELLNMSITVKSRPNGDSRRVVKRVINVVSQCEYMEREGYVVLNFTHHILPYISKLSSHFTKYKAQHVMHMRSGYSVRLYELCLQWMHFGAEREIQVDEFKQLLGLGKKYPKVSMLKARVIKPALADINKHSNLHVDFGQVKAGRWVTHFQFVINKKAKQTATPKKKLTKKYIEQNARPGESWENVKDRLQRG